MFSRKKLISTVIFSCLLLSACHDNCDCDEQTQADAPVLLPVVEPVTNAPLFKNSIVSTEIDYITLDDPSTYVGIEFMFQEEREMPDSRSDELFDSNTYIFSSSFTNGNIIEIWAHSSFESVDVAQGYAIKVAERLGKLPVIMRDKLDHVVVHNGDAGAFAEGDGHFFVLYSDNMDVRISNNDLEETIFHESVHASLDKAYRKSDGWLQAQIDDDRFVTEYAEKNPEREDLAESALFAYTMLKHPGRLSSDIEEWITANIPNRFKFLSDKIFTENTIKVDPFFINSIVSTDIDFITEEDINTFTLLDYKGQEEREMPDSRSDELFDANTFVFEAQFSDGNTVEILAHSAFGEFEVAQENAMKVTGPLGKLPQIMRENLSHVIIHSGDSTAFGESEGQFFVLYSDNMDERIENNDLEETVFHESVHATLDSTYLNSEDWAIAQQEDNAYITVYGANNVKEDLAESALFAYTMIKHPGRLSPEIEAWINDNAIIRLEFFNSVFE